MAGFWSNSVTTIRCSCCCFSVCFICKINLPHIAQRPIQVNTRGRASIECALLQAGASVRSYSKDFVIPVGLCRIAWLMV